jgi:cytochrome c oxidase cbb3-type subunit IV
MDINDLRAMSTVVAFIVFIGIVCWAWSGRRKQDFAAAAMLAVDDDRPVFRAASQTIEGKAS